MPEMGQSRDECLQTPLIPARRPPPDIISYAVWRYYPLNLSHRDIKDLLALMSIIDIDPYLPPAGSSSLMGDTGTYETNFAKIV